MTPEQELELQLLRDQVVSMRRAGQGVLRDTLEQVKVALVDNNDADEAERILREFFGESL